MEECRSKTIDWRSRAERVVTDKMRTTNQSLREIHDEQLRGRQELGNRQHSRYVSYHGQRDTGVTVQCRTFCTLVHSVRHPTHTTADR